MGLLLSNAFSDQLIFDSLTSHVTCLIAGCDKAKEFRNWPHFTRLSTRNRMMLVIFARIVYEERVYVASIANHNFRLSKQMDVVIKVGTIR